MRYAGILVTCRDTFGHSTTVYAATTQPLLNANWLTESTNLSFDSVNLTGAIQLVTSATGAGEASDIYWMLGLSRLQA